MKNFAQFLDYVLVALSFFTYLAITYKALDLYLPRWLGKPSFAQRLGASDTELAKGMQGLESWMTFLAVVASTAPFIGLVGTVLHIMDALRAMGGVADIKIISGPIATALNATLIGLSSAIPAAVAYAFYQRRLQVIENNHRFEVIGAKE